MRDSMITSCSTSFVLMVSHCADWHVDACEEGNGCVGVLWWGKGLPQVNSTAFSDLHYCCDATLVHLSIFHAKDSLGHNFCMCPGTK